MAVVDTFPKLGTIKSKLVQRVITCALMSRAAADSMSHAYNTEEQFNTARPGYYETVLAICIQAAVVGQANALTARAAAATTNGCATVLVSIPVKLQRVGSSYRAIVSAKTYKARSRGPLSVSCRPKGTGMKITLKPRARRAKLRSVLGPHLSIGFSNPSRRSLDIHTKYAFRQMPAIRSPSGARLGVRRSRSDRSGTRGDVAPAARTAGDRRDDLGSSCDAALSRADGSEAAAGGSATS